MQKVKREIIKKKQYRKIKGPNTQKKTKSIAERKQRE